jgi:hypothetical protein
MKENATVPGIGGRLSGELLLILLSATLIAAHLLPSPNRGGVRFVLHKLSALPAEWSFLRSERSPEDRMRANYRMNFDGPIFIRENLKVGEILELPPRTYLSRYYPPGQDGWAEPRFIYYVAGRLKTVPWEGVGHATATHALVVDTLGGEPALRIVNLSQPGMRDRVEELYRASREHWP